MKKLITSLVTVALSTSACAQMPLPLVDNKAPASAPVKATSTPAIVTGLTLVSVMGDLVGLTPRKTATDNCPATARFRLLTMDIPGIQYSAVLTSTKWEQGFTSNGQPICTATVKADQFAGQPRPDIKYMGSVQINNDKERSSPSVELRSVCKDGLCSLLTPAQITATYGPGDKINQQIDALSGQVGKLWGATVGKLTQPKTDECDLETQCPNTHPGTAGETIKTK